MKKKFNLSILAILFVLFFSCKSDNNNLQVLKQGYYHLTKSDNKTNNNSSSEMNFISASMCVKGNDSLIFAENKNIAEAIWGHDSFKYIIRGNRLILKDNDFVKKIPFSITEDSLLKLNVNSKFFINLYFKHLKLELKGKYAIGGFLLVEKKLEDAKKVIGKFLDNQYLEFSDNGSVSITAPLVRLFTNDSTSSNSVFHYKVIEDKILLTSANDSIWVPFVYDGIIRLFVNDPFFERLDLADIK